MCGITGIISSEPLPEGTTHTVAAMCAALEHRGPDESCVADAGQAIIGIRRLAVIDLRPGQLPITNEDGSVLVALNGEIYNYKQLRSELIQSGHRFRTETDTEVIAHLYEEFGIEFARRLEGMFAIAVWDRRQRQALLVRDRLGVKPLFYHQAENQLSFGSEIKSVLQNPSIQRSVNWSAIDRMLTFGCTSAPETFYETIQELPAASVLQFKNGNGRVHRYWDHADVEQSSTAANLNTSDAIDEGLARIRQCVRKRLVSDVPVGAFLSGGIDSSVVVALMSELSEEPIKTFSIGFADEEFSELPYARTIAERFNTEHHEFIVEPEVEQLLPTLIRHHDGPFYDTSAIPTYHLCRMAREHVTVAISGDGGDELFAGYNIFAADRMAQWMGCLPSIIRRSWLPSVMNRVPESSGYTNRGRVIREFLRGADLDPVDRYARWASKVKRETREQLYRSNKLQDCLRVADADHLRGWYDRPDASRLNRLLYTATQGELIGDMLVKVDRMSMASSLEVRSPLLDHSLFEWSMQLPDRLKLNGFRGKYLLRQIATQLLPRNIVRRPKRGFSIPLDRWLRSGAMGWVKQILLDEQTKRRGLFSTNKIQQMINDHDQCRRSYGRELWTLLTTELWLRMYIDDLAVRVDPHTTGTSTLWSTASSTVG